MDSYLYPGTDVLKNIPGIRGAVKLQQFEYEQTASRIVELRRQPLPERFDLAQLQAIHKYLFQDVYEWAGRLRTVNIAKGGTLFALPQYIESEGRRMSTELRAENNLQGLLKDQIRSAPRLLLFRMERGTRFQGRKWSKYPRVFRATRPRRGLRHRPSAHRQ